jgi:hypothetical protein
VEAPLRTILPFLVLAAFLGGCKPSAPKDEAAVRRQLKEKGTLEVLREAEKSTFIPPRDGRLTSHQVEMYLAVRRRERVIRAAAVANLKEMGKEARESKSGKEAVLGALQAVGDVGDVATASLRAAEELGYNPKEVRWIVERIEDARWTGATQGLQGKLAESRAAILARLEERARKTADPQKRRELEEDISLLRSKTEPLGRTPSEADRYNAALLAEHAEELAALRREEIELYADRLGLKPRTGAKKDGG